MGGRAGGRGWRGRTARWLVVCLLGALKLLGLILVTAIVVWMVDGLVQARTQRSAIPASCRQPKGIDYSAIDRVDYGPYAVELRTARHFPWGDRTDAMVGAAPGAEDGVDYGVLLGVESTDIERFRCRWSGDGVTIIEPDTQSGQPGLEHVVPAEQYLGGR